MIWSDIVLEEEVGVSCGCDKVGAGAGFEVIGGGATTIGGAVLVVGCVVRDVINVMNDGAAGALVVVVVGSFLSLKHSWLERRPDCTIPSKDCALTISPAHALVTSNALSFSADLHLGIHPILKSSSVQIEICEL